ncbi:energy-coupling factor ABC transporter substrate-binding protein [Clostridium manihotivorum]|uniref:Cobalt transport protein CbiN n=1 Tax=Clostridium manihotivorum TaxID=2320868 RepID=A0A410DPE3_9CLOT|nr:energy-coupling factor ABC transporter substrate-binding protein [Clostridium manihotivorum]QAA31013.1 energy-coupling factor ABC transporter substrate-binding protein [Clostridium manihotivorum]
MGAKKKSFWVKNIILGLLVVIIAAVPLIFMKNAEFSGSDDQAEKAISDINKDYKPWFKPVWQPPSGEIESLLFAVQAALGSGVVCYYFGYQKGKNRREKEKL